MLAQYSIKKGERSIGSGAFGQVIIGTRRVDGRNYALKHVDSRDEEWKREYQLLSEMRHDTISAGSGSRASAHGKGQGKRQCRQKVDDGAASPAGTPVQNDK